MPDGVQPRDARPEPLPPRSWPAPAMLRRHDDGVVLYSIWADEAAGLVRAEARGCWTLAETDRYVDDLHRFVVASRRLTGRVRLLLDRSGVTIQSAAVAERLAEANGTTFARGDRAALIVDTSLVKACLRRRLPHGGSKAFLSLTAAELWLTA